MIFNKTIFIVISLFINYSVFAGELPENTDISKQVQEFFTAFQTSEAGKKLSKEDWATFEKDKKELAAKMPNPGLKVGDKAPDFKLKNAFGKDVSLSSMTKKGPVILVFYRGGWCSICNIQLHSLNVSSPTFKKYGAQILAVTPQKPERSVEQIKKDKMECEAKVDTSKCGLSFEIVSDLDFSVLKNYNLYFELPKYIQKLNKEKFNFDLADFNGEGRYGLPVPATYIIDKKGIIRSAYARTDYTQRMEPKDILSELKKL